VLTLTSFSPGSGPVGSSVTLTGTNFGVVDRVSLGNVYTSFTRESATQITAVVPAGAAQWPTVRWRVHDGNNAVVHDTPFTITGTPPPPPPPPPPPGGGSCTIASTAGCVPGTTLNLRDTQWVCNRPISSWGPMPLKVIVDYTPGRRYGGNGAIDLVDNCAGDGDPNSIDLIVDVRGDGATFGPGVDGMKVRTEAGYNGSIQLTGTVQCGPKHSPSDHADGVQLQGGRNITFVDFNVGFYDQGLSTCQGAGGAFFYSSAGGYRPQNISVVRGRMIACNHSLNATQANSGTVTGGMFRSGRTDGSDPVCTGYAASDPCEAIANVGGMGTNVCQRWRNGGWQ
jgi:hypothetical protein